MLDQPTVQILIDALDDAAAVLTTDGTVLAVNEAWRRFCTANNGDTSNFYLGANYLHICKASTGDSAELSSAIADGLARVLDGGEPFRFEYPCHSPDVKRWFEMVAKSFDHMGERLCLVSHRNITTRVLNQIEASQAEADASNFAAMVATMPDPVISFDLSGRITSWNAAAQSIYGHSRDEAIGQSMEILYPAGWPKRIDDYIADIVGKGVRHFEAIRQTRTGQRRTVAISAAPIRSASGEIVGVSNVHRDLTEQRQAEQRLQKVLDNLFSFVGVLDLDGTLLEANRAPLEAAGLEAGDVIGKKFWDCYWWSYADDARDRLKAACDRARSGELVRYDTQVRVAGGELIWIDFQLAPMRESDGEIVNLIPSGIDISDRKAAIEALHKSHDTFRSVVERSPLGIYTVDADFRFAHASLGTRAAFRDIDPLIGRDFAEVVRQVWPEPFSEDVISRFRHTLATGEPFRAPTAIERRRDTDEIEAYDWTVERVTMPDGRYGVVCNFYDLSERQRYEEHIRLLMGEVNHRSKNLLTVVLSMARQTARDCTSEEFVERFEQRLLGLAGVQDLLVKGNWAGVTVGDLIGSQLGHLGEDLLEHRVLANGADVLLAPDAAQGIGIALHELSTNALKYGALSVPDGRIVINWTLDPDESMFAIEWQEQGGPPVAPPTRRGFGRTVIERLAAVAVGGKVELDYETSGVRWRMTAPRLKVVASNGQGTA